MALKHLYGPGPVRTTIGYRISRLLGKLIFSVVGRIDLAGREHLPASGPFILAANHISHFDPPLLSFALSRKIDWMAMAELFENRMVAKWLYAVDAFPVDRGRTDRSSVRTALARLKMGHAVGIFPERGIRTGKASLLEGAPVSESVPVLAQMAGAPILPCVIIGTDRLYAAKSWLPLRRTRIGILIGAPVYPAAGENRHEARAAVHRELTEAFRRLSSEVRERFQLSDEDLPQTAQRRKGRE